MPCDAKPQLSQIIDHIDPEAVFQEVEKVFRYRHAEADVKIIRDTFVWVDRLFNGQFPGYRASNTEYHDLGHTMDVLLASCRLADGFELSFEDFPREMETELLLAALLHDTGYIMEEGDEGGTGAKYTKIHVQRSMEFASKHASLFGFCSASARRIARFIFTTDLDPAHGKPDFLDEQESICGGLLGTADLMGQMADRTYLEKLLFLYRELKEAGIGDYTSEFDMLRKTHNFYRMVQARLDGPLQKLYIYAKVHFEKRFDIPHNLYMESIENQMEYLQKIITEDSDKYRTMLKRVDPRRMEYGWASYPVM